MSSSDAPRARLCHVKKVPDFNGYGFNLHAEKGKAGQFIGKIDPGSPAETAGLLENDRIVEVNGTNIGNENHQQVVQRIKAVPNETRMLVVDSEAEQHYKEQGVVIRGDMANVQNGGGVANNVEDPPSKPRLCHIKLWTDFQGYGFNLHAEKNKPGQYIGKVDNDSPAEAGGLREGDRIIEVNGQSVVTDTHAGVVQKVKGRTGETSMLVVDHEADDWFKDEGITVHSALPCVQTIQCPASRTVDKKLLKPNSMNTQTNGMAGGCPYEARLCHVKKWADYDGYGFNMHCVKNKNGEYIGKIEDGSPADLAGLREGDHVVEVNGNNINGETHAQVIGRIKDVPSETKLLVVDADAEAYFDNNGITVHGYMDHMKRVTCPDSKFTANGTATPENEDAHEESHVQSAISNDKPMTHDEVTRAGEEIADDIVKTVEEAENTPVDLDEPESNGHAPIVAAAVASEYIDDHEDLPAENIPDYEYPSHADAELEHLRDSNEDLHAEAHQSRTPSPQPLNVYEDVRENSPDHREPSPEREEYYRDPSPDREPSPSPYIPYREPTPERETPPLREPSPEFHQRDLTPEPPRDPSPEPAREMTPEPPREPSPEPYREPTPEPAREPTPEAKWENAAEVPPESPELEDPIVTSTEEQVIVSVTESEGPIINETTDSEKEEILAASVVTEVESKPEVEEESTPESQTDFTHDTEPEVTTNIEVSQGETAEPRLGSENNSTVPEMLVSESETTEEEPQVASVHETETKIETTPVEAEPEKAPEPKPEPEPTPVVEAEPTKITEKEPEIRRNPAPKEPTGPVSVGGISFGSIADARARASRKKRETARESQLSAKEKFDLFQRL